MTTIDLFDELDDAIARAQPSAARAWREAQGWPRSAALQGIGGGVARIEFCGGDLYQPADREGVGTPAIIIPCWPGPAPDHSDDLVDLLAWVPGAGLFTRRGIADVLGEEAIRQSEPCMGITRPLRIFADPGAWARAHTWNDRGDHGLVVIRWNRVRATLGHLGGAVEFVASDVATGRRLREALQPKAPAAPRILVTAAEQVAA